MMRDTDNFLQTCEGNAHAQIMFKKMHDLTGDEHTVRQVLVIIK